MDLALFRLVFYEQRAIVSAGNTVPAARGFFVVYMPFYGIDCQECDACWIRTSIPMKEPQFNTCANHRPQILSFAELQMGCKRRLVLLYMVEIKFLKIA